MENLARVDVLCLDKTGTITEGSMKVETILDLHGNEINKADSENNAIYEEIKRFALSIDDENTTLDAIRSFFEIEKEHLEIRNENLTIPFSSDKKWSLLSIFSIFFINFISIKLQNIFHLHAAFCNSTGFIQTQYINSGQILHAV